ncbi:MAG: hypothetical protein Q8M99_05620 [Methylotenera sp.]|nr:hypothetical protein [Methylotenera sp.]
MAKNIYSIVVIREGRNKDYHDFWGKNVLTNSAGESLHPDLISFTELVEAKNLNDAISIIQKQFPNLTVALKNSHKIG